MEGMIKSKPISIAYLIHTFPLYSTTFICDEIDEMRRQGVKIKIFSIRLPRPCDYSPEFQRFKDETIYIFPINLSKMLFRNASALVCYPKSYIKTLWGALSWGNITYKDRLRTIIHFLETIYFYFDFRRDNITHIHVHFLSGSASIALFLNSFYGLSYSLTGHGTDIFVEKVLLKEKILSAKFTRIASEFNRNHLSALFPKQDQPLIVAIPFGIDLNNVPVTAKQSDIQRSLQLLSVGRLVWQKAHEILLQACSILNENGILLQVKIVGEGDRRTYLESVRDALYLQDIVSFPGAMPHSQVWAEYTNTDIFVMSSVSEGWGMVLLEAMACGLPVVAPSLNGIPEIIVDRFNGMLFDVGSPESLAAAISELDESPSLRMTLSQNAKRSVQTKYQNKYAITELISLFNNCL